MNPTGTLPSAPRTPTNANSLHLSPSPTSTSTSSYPDEKLVFPNPAVSIFTAISHQAIKTCKNIVRSPSTSSSRGRERSHSRQHHEKAPDMKKMRVVTPVYDHVLERWVWPDSVFADDLAYERRHYRERRSTESSRSSTESPVGRSRGRSSTAGSMSLSLGSTSSRGSTDSRSSRMSRY